MTDAERDEFNRLRKNLHLARKRIDELEVLLAMSSIPPEDKYGRESIALWQNAHDLASNRMKARIAKTSRKDNPIKGRESRCSQCYECVHCVEPSKEFRDKCRQGSCFRCDWLHYNYSSWHMNVPDECPCGGAGWKPKKEEINNDPR